MLDNAHITLCKKDTIIFSIRNMIVTMVMGFPIRIKKLFGERKPTTPQHQRPCLVDHTTDRGSSALCLQECDERINGKWLVFGKATCTRMPRFVEGYQCGIAGLPQHNQARVVMTSFVLLHLSLMFRTQSRESYGTFLSSRSSYSAVGQCTSADSPGNQMFMDLHLVSFNCL